MMSNSKVAVEVRIAAIHALRRITLHYVESGWSSRVPAGSADSQLKKKAMEYNNWFRSQFSSFKEILVQLITSGYEAFHGVAIRSFVEVPPFIFYSEFHYLLLLTCCIYAIYFLFWFSL